MIKAIEHARLKAMAKISQDHESELNLCSVEVFLLPEDFELTPDTLSKPALSFPTLTGCLDDQKLDSMMITTLYSLI